MTVFDGHVKYTHSAAYLYVCLLFSTACTTTYDGDPLADPPLMLHMDVPYEEKQEKKDLNIFDLINAPETRQIQIGPAVVESAAFKNEDTNKLAMKDVSSKKKSCSIKDRFDREALIAYHWGRTGESRLSMDVDGIGYDRVKVDALRIGYTLRLQPHKTKKERCRFTSKWQGLVGSGYNEFIRRDDDTVWTHLKDIRHDVEARFDTLMGH